MCQTRHPILGAHLASLISHSRVRRDLGLIRRSAQQSERPGEAPAFFPRLLLPSTVVCQHNHLNLVQITGLQLHPPNGRYRLLRPSLVLVDAADHARVRRVAPCGYLLLPRQEPLVVTGITP